MSQPAAKKIETQAAHELAHELNHKCNSGEPNGHTLHRGVSYDEMESIGTSPSGSGMLDKVEVSRLVAAVFLPIVP